MQYLTDADLAGERGAHISDCGTYRYRLWREWDRSLPTLAFLMLNPSTADHLTDDPTITRLIAGTIRPSRGACRARSRASAADSRSPTCSRCARPIPTSC